MFQVLNVYIFFKKHILLLKANTSMLFIDVSLVGQLFNINTGTCMWCSMIGATTTM